MAINLEDLENLIVCRMREAATFLQITPNDIERKEKEHWATSGDPGFGGIVTKWDLFVQDFIFGGIRSHFDGIRLYGEEENGCLFKNMALSQELTLIIDPIDGTEWFSRGEDEFSILVTLLKDFKAIWSAGLFPKKRKLFIASGNRVFIDTMQGKNKTELTLTGTPAETTIAAHYRLGRGDFRKGYDNLARNGFKILMNGDGFGTNLTAVEKFFQNDVSAFIAAKMSIVDGFPIAHLIKSAGGVLRFFDSDQKIDKWTPAEEWSFQDFGPDGGKRTRFIAARSEKQLDTVVTKMEM